MIGCLISVIIVAIIALIVVLIIEAVVTTFFPEVGAKVMYLLRLLVGLLVLLYALECLLGVVGPGWHLGRY